MYEIDMMLNRCRLTLQCRQCKQEAHDVDTLLNRCQLTLRYRQYQQGKHDVYTMSNIPHRLGGLCGKKSLSDTYKSKARKS